LPVPGHLPAGPGHRHSRLHQAPASAGPRAKASTQEWEIITERLDLLLGDPALVGVLTAAAGILG
jgi:hypothetical protein